MELTVLCENTAINNDFQAEHGLSLYIETEKHNILFDFGQSDLFAANAEKSEIDLSSVDIAFLSHGHYDHSGGLKKFMEINNKAEIYINENAFGYHYNGTEKYIGINRSLKGNKRFTLTGDLFEIDKELSLQTGNAEIRSFPDHSQGLNIKSGDNFIQDKFLHEQYLIINENSRKILISGCSHKGILNIAEWYKPDVLIGGFHISKLDTENSDVGELNFIAEKLLCNSTTYYTCHCTGVEQFDYLKKVMGDKVCYLSAGQTINI